MTDVQAGRVEEIASGEMRAVEVGSRAIAVAHEGDSFFAFSDVCTHQQCSLHEGDIEDGRVVCPCHGSAFDLATGAVVNPPATEPIEVYPVRVEGGNVIVSVD